MSDYSVGVNLDLVWIYHLMIIFQYLPSFVEVQWKDIFGLQNILDGFNVIILQKASRVFFDFADTHVPDVGTNTFKLCIDFYKVGDWHTCKLLQIDAWVRVL